ncbi:unnamed protein product, partial [Rotaria sordida]
IRSYSENCFGKRKYNRDRLITSQQWVFGGIDLTTRKCILVLVDQRDATTLIPIIEEFILSDNRNSITAYFQLSNNTDYTHLTVNHSLRFVDPTAGVHTQNIENTWMHVK